MKYFCVYGQKIELEVLVLQLQFHFLSANFTIKVYLKDKITIMTCFEVKFKANNKYTTNKKANKYTYRSK